MNQQLPLSSLDNYIYCLSQLEHALNEYRTGGGISRLQRMSTDEHSRRVLELWLSAAGIAGVDNALSEMERRSIRTRELSPYFDIMLHCQPEWKGAIPFIHIAYVYSGSFSCSLSQYSSSLHQGLTYIFNVGTEKTILPDSESAQLLNCIISKKYFDHVLLEELEQTALYADFLANAFNDEEHAVKMLTLETEANQQVRSVFASAIIEQLCRKPMYENAVNGMVRVLMVQLIRTYIEYRDLLHYTELRQNRLSDVLSYIEENCAAATLKEISAHFHFNPSYFSHIIRQNTGMTFTEILQRARLIQAERLLRTTDLPVTEIANAVGYHNLTHFYRLFRVKHGFSPSDYRKKLIRN